MRLFFHCLFLLSPLVSRAQDYVFPMDSIPLTDLSGFKPAKANWRITGDAFSDLAADDVLSVTNGNGVLVNLPDAQNRSNLVTNFEHGDLDLELDIMMARHSNSGIYLQGRYEIQLFDSWGKKNPSFSDLGGVYERWDNSKPEGQKGFEGIAPRVNVARAPGLWQHLRIEFQAPRFDVSGKKTANARLLKIILNGVTVQENIVLTGPTRGDAFPGEAVLGPILIQGDHGPVAFRNIRYRTYGDHATELSVLKYRYFAGEYEELPDFGKSKAESSGPAEGLTWEYAKGDNDFALQFTGSLQVPKAGKYLFAMHSSGNGLLVVNGDTVLGPGWWDRSGVVDLPAGAVPIEIAYCKKVEWVEPALALFVEGLHFRKTALHLASSYTMEKPTNPILLEPGRETELLRSFIDIPTPVAGKSKRIVHAISIGYPEHVSYSYDLDNGALIQVWKGGFLDVTPMWNDRGDGHADPAGSMLFFGDAPQVSPASASWPDTLPSGSGYHFIGYQLDASDNPTFQYSLDGLEIKDRLLPKEDGKWLSREISISGHSDSKPQFRVAYGKRIIQLVPGTWAIDDRHYYIKLPSGIQPEIRNSPGGQEMLLPATGTIQYDLIW